MLTYWEMAWEITVLTSPLWGFMVILATVKLAKGRNCEYT